MTDKDARVRDSELFSRYEALLSRILLATSNASVAEYEAKQGRAFDPSELAELESAKADWNKYAGGLRALLKKYDCLKLLTLQIGTELLPDLDPIEYLFDTGHQRIVRRHLEKIIASARLKALLAEESARKSLPPSSKAMQRPQDKEPEGAVISAAEVRTPAQLEALISDLATQMASLKMELEALKKRERKNEWLAPSILLVLAGLAGGGLAYYVHGEVKATLTTKENIELIDAQIEALHLKDSQQKLGQSVNQQSPTQPNHSASSPTPVSSNITARP